MKFFSFSIFILALSSTTFANDQLRAVGSSTVYPFASYVAEELGSLTKYKTPIIESTGTGGGMKLFCKGEALNTPSITNASRPIKAKELKLCKTNQVNAITEIKIGYDGISVANSKKAKQLKFTKRDLALALLSLVPNKDKTKLITNPYKKWSDINPSLPNTKIAIYGPPTSSGTRDALEEMLLQKFTKKITLYKQAGYKKYSHIRQDGFYVPSGENDNLIIQKITKNKNAIGIFGYSFLQENQDQIIGISIDGILPSAKNIMNGSYVLARSLFFYIKNAHLKKVPSLKSFINMFLSEDMIGEKGGLSEIGLIALPPKERQAMRQRFENKTPVAIHH